MIQTIAFLIPYLVLLAELAFFVVLGFVLAGNIKVKEYVKNHAVLLAFIVALTAMCGSLFYSEVMHYIPCELCWFQRIFMFSQVFMLGSALAFRIKRIMRAALVMSAVGGSISVYHYFTQMFTRVTSCTLGDTMASCSAKFTYHFGYMTIPVMALTAFVIIAALAVVSWRK